MKTSDFLYDLPEELIAQTPIEPRDHSRMMVVNPATREIAHKRFYDLPGYLRPGDALVINETRVLPARLYGEREGGGTCEVLLLKQLGPKRWETLVKPGRKLRPGTTVSFGSGKLTAAMLSATDAGGRIVDFRCDGPLEAVLDELGEMPLPPYIHEKLDDSERYQTVYAKEKGSAAAPTAGLHFTPALLDAIRRIGVHVVPVVLHVGLGTFRPVKVEDVKDHVMHSEFYSLSDESAETINRCVCEGGRVFAVGTTSVRVLESAAVEKGVVAADSGWTDIFIYPGYDYKMVDALITNFHLPGSTLLMLVSALMGGDQAKAAYREAVQKKYRFFSFGDSMLVLTDRTADRFANP